jgi:hypothetical protein
VRNWLRVVLSASANDRFDLSYCSGYGLGLFNNLIGTPARRSSPLRASNSNTPKRQVPAVFVGTPIAFSLRSRVRRYRTDH